MAAGVLDQGRGNGPDEGGVLAVAEASSGAAAMTKLPASAAAALPPRGRA